MKGGLKNKSDIFIRALRLNGTFRFLAAPASCFIAASGPGATARASSHRRASDEVPNAVVARNGKTLHLGNASPGLGLLVTGKGRSPLRESGLCTTVR